MRASHLVRPLAATLLLAVLLPTGAEAKLHDWSGRGFTGENPLGVPRVLFQYAQEGLELGYQGRYKESWAVFDEASVIFPDSPLGPVGKMFGYEAEMFENYDFATEPKYREEQAEAEARFEIVIDHGGQQAWNLFLRACSRGMDAMHDTRRSEYLSAFNKAWDALEDIKKVETLATQFRDIQLAFGLYNYWRTVITEEVDYLPNFGDRRKIGLAQMEDAKKNGLLARAPASLALTWSYLEDRNYEKTFAEGLWARANYPKSVINELTLARAYRMAGKSAEAVAALDRVAVASPGNKRLWFHYGETFYKQRRDNARAREAYQKYLATKPDAEFTAHTYYRLALLDRRERNYDGAIGWMEKAVAAFPKWKQSGERLAELRELKAGRRVTTSGGKSHPRKAPKAVKAEVDPR